MTISTSCAICTNDCVLGSVLTSGQRYHEQCYTWLVAREAHVNYVCQQESAAQAGWSAAFSRWLGLTSSDALKSSLEEHKQLRNLLWRLHSFWPDYPPDWDIRRTLALGSNPYCENCGAQQHLHVHHKVPLSRGGSNEQKNLSVLCERCHSEAHGGRSFGARVGEPARMQRNLKLIQQAIAAKNGLRFSYKKYGEASETRTVTPLRITSFRHQRKEGSTLCLEAFCQNRNGMRFFKIKSITRMKLITEPR